MSYAPGESWNLDVLFPGGPTSLGFAAALDEHAERLLGGVAELGALPSLGADVQGWRRVLAAWVDCTVSLSDLSGLVYCHMSAHTDDLEARAVLGRIQDLEGTVAAGEVIVDAALGQATDAELDALAVGELSSWRESFERTRREHRLQLEPALQALLAEADREALHAWGQLYDNVVGPLTAWVEQDGERHLRSLAQLGVGRSSHDPAYRLASEEAAKGAFDGTVSEVCAAALNALTGTRQMRLDRVGAGPLANSLISNRIDRAVLDAMWEGAEQVLPDLVRYLDLKAALLRRTGVRDTDKLRWCDHFAPVGALPGGATLSWPDAQDLIVDAFDAFEPDLAEFSRNLLREGGVEAEARPNKRSGGYCAGFTQAKTSRIFLTFGGSVLDSVVLAHELGHAWHNHLLGSSPPGRRHITMSLAESASTFAESIVRDQIAATATTREARLAIVDQQLQAAVGMLMNIRARFDFELSLYEMRREGPLTAGRLSERMLDANRAAYHGALHDYDEKFWARKLHFYISHFGFYNWPYTFGYLFSGALYTRATAEGPGFRKNVTDLLVRTGWQDSVPLAAETLGVDLTDARFWAEAAAPVRSLVDEFAAVAGYSAAGSS